MEEKADKLIDKLRALNLYEAEEEGWHILRHEGAELPWSTWDTFKGMHLPDVNTAGFREAGALEIFAHAGTDRALRRITLVWTWMPPSMRPILAAGQMREFIRDEVNWPKAVVPVPRQYTVLVRVNGYAVVDNPGTARAFPSPFLPGITTKAI